MRLGLAPMGLELGYYYRRWSVRVGPRVAERVMPEDLRKLENFRKSPKMLGVKGKYPAGHPK